MDRVIKTYENSLRFDLDDDERIAAVEKLRELNDILEAKKTDFAAEKKRMEEQKRKLLDAAANGYEFRNVPCEVRSDDDRLQIITIRLDTGEELSRRAMSVDERQQVLGLS